METCIMIHAVVITAASPSLGDRRGLCSAGPGVSWEGRNESDSG